MGEFVVVRRMDNWDYVRSPIEQLKREGVVYLSVACSHTRSLCSHTHAHMCTRSLFSLLRERKGVIAFDLREVIQIVLYAARPNVFVGKRKISNPFVSVVAMLHGGKL